PGKIFRRLPIRLLQIFPGTLLLNEQYAFPEHINKPGIPANSLDLPLKNRNTLPADAKHLKKLVQKSLAITPL
ncbi:MAG: hypothetical protein LBU83_02315, partial [Bacteroidales bacterium]|nr:hypothetical protein [Bacteroidales bacterium]